MSAVFRSAAGRDAVLAAYRALLAAWPVPSEHRRVATCLGDTFVVVCGPAEAPPLVLVHGAQANAAAYLFDVALWSPHFRVHVVDVVGEAGLSAEVRPPLDGDAHARWLDDVLDGLGLARAAFVGTSLGGWLALDYARRRPARVTRLALLCPAGIGRQKNFLLRALPLLLLGGWGRRRLLAQIFGPPPTTLTPLQRQLGALIELIGRNIVVRRVTIPRLSDAELSRLPPTLVILGGDDVLLDSYDTRARLAAHCPQATVHLDPDGRHFLPGRAPEILAFLRAAPAA